jgi:predicted MPP superfamily phosphohydrolase
MGPRRSAPGLTRRSLLRIATGVGAGFVVGEASYGALYERHHLELTRADLPCPGLPPALDGLRVGLITDTHYSAYTALPFIARAVALLQQQSPDLVVLGGDYVTRRNRTYIPDAATPFADLRAPHGVFGVLGNHDDDVEVPRVLRRRGVTVLRDARTRLTIRGETVDLLGVRYWTHRLDDIARIARGRAPFSILLAHDPRRLWEASALRIPLVLSGHTHGGQVSLPLIGALAAQKYPVAHGTRVDAETTLFVSRGVGTVLLPCRIDCPPEVAVLTLRPAAPGAAGGAHG